MFLCEDNILLGIVLFLILEELSKSVFKIRLKMLKIVEIIGIFLILLLGWIMFRN